MSSESTAKNLFAAGVESAASGSYAPFVIAVMEEYINAWMAAIEPGESCAFVSNPDGLTKCDIDTTDDSSECFSGITGTPESIKPYNQALALGVRDSFFSRGMGGRYHFPPPPNQPPCEQRGAFPNSCLYDFKAWNDLVDRTILRKASGYSREALNDYWTGWKALTLSERRSRYRYNAKQCIDWAVARGLTDEQRVAFEMHFGGRWSGQIFRFDHEIIDEHPIGSYAAWIPLGYSPKEAQLRRIYNWLYFDGGLTLKDLGQISTMEPTEGFGMSFALLPVEKQRGAMAQAYVIEAVRAAADSDKYLDAHRVLRAQEEQDLGWERTGVSPRDLSRPGFTKAGKPHTTTDWDIEAAAERLAKAARKKRLGGAAGSFMQTASSFAQTAGQAVRSTVSTPTRAAVSGAVVLGVAGAGYWAWRRYGKKIKAKAKKLTRRLR